MQSYTSVDYDPKLDIRNIAALPMCKGAKYLLCIFGPTEDILIAKSWHRKYPDRKAGEVVVVFQTPPKITARQEGGDDGYCYVIRINGKQFITG